MARRTPTIPISPAMFRHFAIITVLITAALAMFADGEQAEAIEETVKDRQALNRAQEVDVKRAGKTKLNAKFGQLVDNRSNQGSFDGGGDGGWGGDSGSVTPDFVPSEVAAILPTPADIPGGMPGDRKRGGVIGKPAPPAPPTPEQVEKMLEMSRLRSGA